MPKGKISMGKKTPAPKPIVNDSKKGDGYRTQSVTTGNRNKVTTKTKEYYTEPGKTLSTKAPFYPGKTTDLKTGSKRVLTLKNGRRETASQTGNAQLGMRENYEVQYNRGSGTRKTGAKKKAY
jgi:hypothetical protein